jgi:hypothetical protein
MNDPFEKVAELLTVDLPAPPEDDFVAEGNGSVPPQLRNPNGRPKGEEAGAEYCSIFEHDQSRLNSPLVNQRPVRTEYKLKREKWEHRCIALLKAQGFSNKEISEQTGYTPVSVSNILRQPWIRDLIMQEIKLAGRDAVQELLHASTYDSVTTLIEIRDNPDNSARDRMGASVNLLNRTYGMPNQPITHNEGVKLENLSDEELAKIVNKGRSN